jgi:hypothetical protein
MLSIASTTFQEKIHDNALVYLVQNKKFTMMNQFGFARENVQNRMDLFHMSLSYFIDHFHPEDDKVDIHIFHEGDLTTEHALRAAKTAKRFPVFFHSIRFEFPKWLSKSDVEESIASSDIPGWRDMGYRHMCRFYSLQVYPLLIQWKYNKMMRLDDDSFTLENLPLLFRAVSPKDPYKARLLQKESETFCQFFYPYFHSFCETHRISCPPETDPDFYLIPFNNFFVVDLSVYEQPIVLKYLDYMDKTGGIYKYRWGDALVQGIMIKYVCGISDIPLFTFRYSKWGLEYEEESLELFQDTMPMKTFQGLSPFLVVWIVFILLVLILFCQRI